MVLKKHISKTILISLIVIVCIGSFAFFAINGHYFEGFHSSFSIAKLLKPNICLSKVNYGLPNKSSVLKTSEDKQVSGDENSYVQMFDRTTSDRANAICKSSDGNYIVAGAALSMPNNWRDFFVAKVKPNGRVVWAETFGGHSDDEMNAVCKITDGGCMATGWTWSLGGEGLGWKNSFITKIDSNGKIVWSKVFGGKEWDQANSICQTTDGGFVVAGYTTSFGSGDRDVFITKIDSNGKIVWSKVFGGKEWDQANSICQTTDGGFVVAGNMDAYNTVWDWDNTLIMRLTPKGNLSWAKSAGGDDEDRLNAITEITEGNYVAAGYTWSFNSYLSNVLLIKLNEKDSCSLFKDITNAMKGRSVVPKTMTLHINERNINFTVTDNPYFRINSDADTNQKVLCGEIPSP